MPLTIQQIKQQLSQYANDFQIEDNSFKKISLIHEYLEFIDNNEKLGHLFKGGKGQVQDFLVKATQDKLKPDLKAEDIVNVLGDDFIQPDLSVDEHPIKMEMAKAYYSGLSVVASGLDVYKIVDDEKRKKLEKSFDEIVSDKQKITTFNLFFTMLNTDLFNYLDKEEFLNKGNDEADKQKAKISFDPKQSVLNFKGEEIKITRKNDLPADHYILDYLFEQEDLDEENYYKQIAKGKIADFDYHAETEWNKYYKACQRLQDKIRTSTKTKIDDFLIFNSGKTAYVKINPKYIKSCLKNKPSDPDE